MATETVVLCLEGVLAGTDDTVNLAQTMLDPTGALLYTGLAQSSRLILATALDRRMVGHWCRTVGLTAHMDTCGLDTKTIGRLRSGGDNPTLYIDANQERVAAALQDGVASMLFTRSLFARASHRPDLVGSRLPRPWNQIQNEFRAQEVARDNLRTVLTEDVFREDTGD